jgi:hypothetical protein
MAKIFISHAASDKKIAEGLQEFLVMGLDLKSSDFFCSSLPGRRAPGGCNYVEEIKEKLDAAEVVILLLTPNYFDSIFCIAEVGACWISEKNAVPVLVPPITYDDLKATLSLTQSWKIDSRSDLESLADDINKKLQNRGEIQSHSLLGITLDRFLERLPALLEAQTFPVYITSEELDKEKKRVESLTKEKETLEKELAEKKTYIGQLEGLKDAVEVTELKLTEMPAMEKFQKLCSEVERALSKVSRIVSNVAYYHVKGEDYPDIDYRDKSLIADIESGINKQFLKKTFDEKSVELNTAHPLIKKLLAEVKALKDFMYDSEEARQRSHICNRE